MCIILINKKFSSKSSSFVNIGNEVDIQYGAGMIQGKSAVDVLQVKNEIDLLFKLVAYPQYGGRS
mgnify:CR=1 FL=1